jgi:hypothetical protein
LKAFSLVEKWKDRIKWGGNNKMPPNKGPLYRSYFEPTSGRDIRIFWAEISVEDGGVPAETELILLSWASHFCHSQRFYTEIFPKPEPVGKGMAIGAGNNYTKILDSEAGMAFSVNPMLGISWTEVDWPYAMSISLYNTGPVWLYDPWQLKQLSLPQKTTQVTLPSAEPITWIYFNTDKYNVRKDQVKKLDKIVGYIVKYWEELLRMGHVIIFDGHCDIRYEQAYNDWLGMQRAKTARDKVRDILLKKGYPREIVEAMLLFKSSGWRVSDKKLSDNDRHVEVFRAKPLSKRPKERNTPK